MLKLLTRRRLDLIEEAKLTCGLGLAEIGNPNSHQRNWRPGVSSRLKRPKASVAITASSSIGRGRVWRRVNVVKSASRSLT